MRYWAKKENNTILYVESYSHDKGIPGLSEVAETEFNNFLNSLPLSPAINWKQEWLNAGTTVSERLKVIARRLDLV